MNYQTLQVHYEGHVCFIRLHRPDANNTINDTLINECHQVLSECEDTVTVVVLEGSPEVFCFGADFNAIKENAEQGGGEGQGPEPLYELWYRMVTASFVTIAHVRGKANAGGVGFVAASDIVLADTTALFSLSELLFGLFPACVLPYLIRRIGQQRAHYMTLMTKPVDASTAQEWGLVDQMHENSERLLRTHLSRLKCLSKKGISRYKKYMNELNPLLVNAKSCALEANREVFNDSDNIAGISRYVETGQFPWEA